MNKTVPTYLNILIFQGDIIRLIWDFLEKLYIELSDILTRKKAIINVEKNEKVCLLCSKFRVFWSMNILDIGVKHTFEFNDILL